MSGAGEQADPTISAVASFFIPGLGHALINDQMKRGIIVFLLAGVVDFLIILVSTILAFIVIGVFGYLLLPVVHIVAAYDAYSQANKINAGEIVP
jgi:hypothetical protein